MRHIEKFQIHQFRGVRDLKLEGLGQVNLLVGGNNSGKTSVLEAIELHCHPMDLTRLVGISKKRDAQAVRLPRIDSLKWMFPIRKGEKNSEWVMGDISISSEKALEIADTLVRGEEIKVVTSYPESKNYFLKVPTGFGKTGLTNLVVKEESSAYKTDDTPSQDMVVEEVEKEVRAMDMNLSYRISNVDGTEELKVWESDLIITDAPIIRRGINKEITISSEFVTPTDHRLLPLNSDAISQLILNGHLSQVIDLLKMLDCEIEDLQILAPNGDSPVPYLKHVRLGFAPITIFGDGVRRVLTLAASVVNCRDGILLIDEVETAVHVEALEKVITWLVKACQQYNVQLFATTHSLEAIDAILAVFLESKEVQENSENWKDILQNFVTYRLVPRGETTVVKRFAGDKLADIRYDFGQDVR